MSENHKPEPRPIPPEDIEAAAEARKLLAAHSDKLRFGAVLPDDHDLALLAIRGRLDHFPVNDPNHPAWNQPHQPLHRGVEREDETA